MAWQSIIESGDTVQTPHGTGTVRATGASTAQVKVDGQLFEVPLDQITKEGAKPEAPKAEFEVGDWVTVPDYDPTEVRKITGKADNGTYQTAQINPESGAVLYDYSSYRDAKDFKKYPKQRKDTEGAPVPEAKPTPVSRYMAQKGDRVQLRDRPQEKGTINEITQRSIKVKFDSGYEESFQKSTVRDKLDRAQEGEAPQPEAQPEAKLEVKSENKPVNDQGKDVADELYGLLNLKQKLEEKIETSVDAELQELRELAKKNQKLEVKVGEKVNVIEGLKHKQLEQLINYAALRLSPLLVGMAGTGKTHAGEQTAVALGLDFYAMSVGAQTSKSDIIGYMAANGNYVSTHFRKAYEEGGVFLMDEIDAGNANVLIQINAALSNGLCAFPDAMVKRHEDFVFIASANTFGNGANRQYVGRNQLDAATLDRFAMIEWFIDDELESNLAFGLNGKAWYMAVRAARDYVAEKNIRALISPRATQKGSKLLDVGQDVKEVIHATMLGSVPEDKRADVEQVATSIFEKFASEVPGQLPKSVDPVAKVDDLLKPSEAYPF